MIDTPWLILDCNFLAWRNFHALRQSSLRDPAGVPTEVVFGFLRDVIHLQDRFATNNVAFCFDHTAPCKRMQHSPIYKAKRIQTYSDEETKSRLGVRKQLQELHDDFLPRIGYRNVFAQKGYEADDIIAALCRKSLRGKSIVIVSADKDLYQLLRPEISQYNPNTKVLHTFETFNRDYGISPAWWSRVKAIAGWDSDNIPGIKGVGEKTAIRYILGQLNVSGKAFQNIREGREVWKSNLELTALPYPGVKIPKIAEDAVNAEQWDSVAKELGMLSLVGQCPGIRTGKMRGQS